MAIADTHYCPNTSAKFTEKSTLCGLRLSEYPMHRCGGERGEAYFIPDHRVTCPECRATHTFIQDEQQFANGEYTNVEWWRITFARNEEQDGVQSVQEVLPLPETK